MNLPAQDLASSDDLSVLHVIAPSRIGGAERVVRDSAVAQQQHGLGVAVLALLDPSGPEPWMVTALRSTAVGVETVRARHRHYVAEAGRIRQVAQERRVDLLHCHGYRADVLGAVAARGARLPWVATAHGFTGGGARNRLYEWLDLRVLRRANGVIVVSSQLKSRIERRGVDAGLVHLVPNAVMPLRQIGRTEARAELGLDESSPVVGWVGRLSREKGPDVLLEAIAQVPGAEVTAVLVGDGPEQAATRRAAQRLGLSDRIHLPGVIPDAGRIFSAFDVLVLSSRTEGLPIVLLEAMAAGVPVVATAVGEVAAVTEHGRWATLVPPDDPSALAMAMADTVRNLEAARERAARAIHHVQEHYGVTQWVRRLADVYRRAVEGGPAGR